MHACHLFLSEILESDSNAIHCHWALIPIEFLFHSHEYAVRCNMRATFGDLFDDILCAYGLILVDTG